MSPIVLNIKYQYPALWLFSLNRIEIDDLEALRDVSLICSSAATRSLKIPIEVDVQLQETKKRSF